MLFIGDFAILNGQLVQCCSAIQCPKHKKAVMCVTQEICVLDKLHSGVSYSVVGHEFNVDESTICIKYGIYKQKHTQNKVMY